MSESDKPARDENGRLLPGGTANPEGHNGANHFTPWKNRVTQLSEKYDTVEKLMALFTVNEAGQLVPSSEFKKMNPIDAGLIWNMIGQVSGDDKRLEREAFWDRFEGKPVQKNEVTGKNGTPIFGDAKQRLLSKFIPPVITAGKAKDNSGDDGAGSGNDPL